MRIIKTIYELITKDSASPGLRQIAGTADTAGTKSKAAAEKGTSAWKRFSEVVKTGHAAMEIAGKFAKAFDSTVGESIRKAIEYRGANDAAVKSIHSFGREVDEAAARAGDFLVPALAGASKLGDELATGFNKWATENRALIQTGVVEWAVKLSTALVYGVAEGAKLAIQSFSGWKLIIKGTEAAYHGLIAAAASAGAAFAAPFGADEQKWERRRIDLKILALDHRALARVAGESIKKTVADMEKAKRETDAWAASLTEKIGKAGVDAVKNLGSETAFASEKARKAAADAEAAEKKARDSFLATAAAVRAKFEAAEAADAARRKETLEGYEMAKRKWSTTLAELAKENAANAGKRAKEAWEKSGTKEFLETAKDLSTGFFSSLATGFLDAALHAKNFGEVAVAALESIAAKILELAIVKSIGAIFDFALNFIAPGAGALGIGSGIAGAVGGAIFGSGDVSPSNPLTPVGTGGSGLGSSSSGVSSSGSGLSSSSSSSPGGRTTINITHRSLLPVSRAEQQRLWRRDAEAIAHQVARSRG